MRNVTISKRDFDEVVYPSLHDAPLATIYPEEGQTEKVRRIQWKLLDALEEQAEPVGGGLYPMYQLPGTAATFELDDREADMLRKVVVFAADRLAGVRSRSLRDLLDRCENGDPDIGADGVVEERQAAAGD